MRDWLILATNLAVDAIDWLALVLIVVGAVEAFFQGLWTMLASPDGHHERDVWLRLGRWLVAGLTFQLAADVLETAITTSWDEVARLAAIAAIRTFLNYFLERDLGEIRTRQKSVQSESDLWWSTRRNRREPAHAPAHRSAQMTSAPASWPLLPDPGWRLDPSDGVTLERRSSGR